MNYNLQEFKEWLEEDSNRKEGLNWTGTWLEKRFANLVKDLDIKVGDEIHNGEAYWPYKQVIKKWITERERERERERESRIKLQWK